MVKLKLDTLFQQGVDTLIVYHHYCIGCELIKDNNSIPCKYNDSGQTNIENDIIFKKAGQFYIMKLTCDGSAITNKIQSISSIPYFISIIPTLNKRDAEIKQRQKRLKFFPPIPTHGSYTDALLIFNNKQHKVSLSDYQRKEGYEYWKDFFWITKEKQLINLIEQDLR